MMPAKTLVYYSSSYMISLFSSSSSSSSSFCSTLNFVHLLNLLQSFTYYYSHLKT